MNQNVKTALITGAGSGIGRAVAQALANDNWHLILTGRTKEPLEKTADLCEGNQHLVFPADVTDPAGVRQLF